MWWWIVLVLVLVLGVAVWVNYESKEVLSDIRDKSVFISGCDTGFGNALALRLDKLGLKVFAGCLTDNGAKELRAQASSQLETIICDITVEEVQNIIKAVRIVESMSPSGVWALVNNAGIGTSGEWDWFPTKHFRRVMEVNFFGHVAVTKAFLPLLKKTKGRIINLTSVAGVVAPPGLGSYCCSKFALEAFSDSLRREMKKWEIKVYVIEPGFTATPMTLNVRAAQERCWNDASAESKAEYGEEYGHDLINRKLPPLSSPETVIDVLVGKVVHKNPSLRTRVGALAHVAYFAQTYLPAAWTDFAISMLERRPLPAALKKQS